ncbi:MAG: hypothetical protein IPJ88_02720 [Myxococcales bacterium]|nr:MAG: hypothetical protein IPJ88_02720 [Myxococcales bacterium]
MLANFSVIFAPNPKQAVAEMFRVLRPGDRMVLSPWLPKGAIYEVGELLNYNKSPKKSSPWSDRSSLKDLFGIHSAEIEILEEEIVFEESSAQAWFTDLEMNHPVWRAIRNLAGDV